MTHPSAPPSDGRTRSLTPWLVAGVAVVIAAIAAIALVSRGSDDTTGDGSSSAASTSESSASSGTTGQSGQSAGTGPVVNGPVTIAGTPLQKVANGADKAIGAPFPTLSGQSVLTGAPLSIANDGRPKVILYVAHWCPHCQKEVPLIQKWIDDNGLPKDVDLYAVSTGVMAERGNYPPAAWLTKVGWTVPTMADSANNDAFTAAGLASYPSFVVVNAAGKVVQRASGELSIAEFTDLLDLARGK